MKEIRELLQAKFEEIEDLEVSPEIPDDILEKGKTYWDYSGGATPGNERLVTQIQSKGQKKYDKYLSRREIKKFLKTENSQKLYNKLESLANAKFGEDKDSPEWRAYTYGGLVTAVARILASDKEKNKGVQYLL